MDPTIAYDRSTYAVDERGVVTERRFYVITLEDGTETSARQDRQITPDRDVKDEPAAVKALAIAARTPEAVARWEEHKRVAQDPEQRGEPTRVSGR